MRAPTRTEGFAPIEDYAAIGDGRALALVALDGAIDWLCLPTLDDPPVFFSLLDPDGGSFTLRPRAEFVARRHYIDESNVLETIFTTSSGTVKVTDAILLDGGAVLPWVELVRRVECLEGEVELEWQLSARPRWGRAEATASMREDVALVEWDDEAIALLSYDCGTAKTTGGDAHGRFKVECPANAMLAALYFRGVPYAVPPRAELELRLERTRAYWQTYSREIPYDGPWLGAVRRGVLVQRMLTYEPTGAIVAAPTTSLPERIGGDRNWDYRYSWVRDTSLALESLLAVRLSVECQRSLAWVLDATRKDGQLQPMYTLHGEPDLPREDIDITGYRGSTPVRVGNDAQNQLQLGTYANVIDAAYRFCGAGHVLDYASAARCAELANDVCEVWSKADGGIWEVEPHEFTESTVGCWSALDRAIALAEQGRVPDDDVRRWRTERDAIRDWVETNCWSESRGAYVLHPGSDELDASLLLLPRFGYAGADDERFLATLDAIRRELAHGPFLYRTSGLRGQEGCFLACSFWLVDALARIGRIDEARSLMDELVPAANDVGLYAEQIDPETGAALGNFPQALTHLSLILAAVSVMRAERSAI